jgi:adenylate kinase family enzyme
MKLMRRVLVLGCGGAGKSTFARRLGAATGLPVVHLDARYWRAGWVGTRVEDWRRIVTELIAEDAWILDGNYAGTLDLRVPACDTAIFLDAGRVTCLGRVIKRRIQFHGRARPDVPAGCEELLGGAFLRWIWRYPRRGRPVVLAHLAALRPDQRGVILDSTEAVEGFLRTAARRR